VQNFTFFVFTDFENDGIQTVADPADWPRTASEHPSVDRQYGLENTSCASSNPMPRRLLALSRLLFRGSKLNRI
jgi:hypothetical protein